MQRDYERAQKKRVTQIPLQSESDTERDREEIRPRKRKGKKRVDRRRKDSLAHFLLLREAPP